MALADYEFSRPNPLNKDIALGHIMLDGRSDMAALAMNPQEAAPEEVRACAAQVTGAMMNSHDAEAYLDAVATVFPQINQGS